MNWRTAFCLLIAPIVSAQAADTNSAGAAREYTNRVQLYDVDLNVKGPVDHHAVQDSRDDDRTWTPDLESAITPPTFIPARRPVPDKKKTEKGWLDTSGKAAKDGKKPKEDSGWGWLADEVLNSKNGKDSDGKEIKDADEKDADADADGNDSEDDEKKSNADRSSSGRKSAYFMDQSFEPRLEPTVFKDSPSSQNGVPARDNPNAMAPIVEDQKISGPAGLESARDAGPSSTDFGAPAAPNMGRGSSAADDTSYSPTKAGPTAMPGESLFQSTSSSLDDTHVSLGFWNTSNDSTPAGNSMSEGALGVSVTPSDAGLSVGSESLGGDSQDTHKSALPW